MHNNHINIKNKNRGVVGAEAPTRYERKSSLLNNEG